jgi:hypothetical protein
MNRLLTATLALSFFPVLLGTPNNTVANSQIIAQNAAPRIDSFQVEPIDRLTPGSELVFILEGTPKANVTVTVGDVARNIPAREVRPGYYEARYTIRRQDNLSEDTRVRANLQSGNRRVTARLTDSLVATGNTNNRTGDIAIDRFTVQPVESLEPGTELVFTLAGTPGATATYTIEGIAYDRAMREVSPGQYEGRYVIRRQDVLSSDATATAVLKQGNRFVNARLDGNIATGNTANNAALPLEILSPANNATVGNTVELRGKSAPNATIAINVIARNNVIGPLGFQRSVLNDTARADERGNFSFRFQPSGIVPGTRYEVNLSASKGQQTRQQTLVLQQQ